MTASQAGLVNGLASAAGIGWARWLSGLLVEYARCPEVAAVRRDRGARGARRVGRLAPARDGRARRPALTLTPRVPAVPRALWRTFALSGLGVLAAWSVGGLYLALGPGIIYDSIAPESRRRRPVRVPRVCASRPLAQWVMRAAHNRTTLVGGAALLAIGSVITAIAVSAGSLDRLPAR